MSFSKPVTPTAHSVHAYTDAYSTSFHIHSCIEPHDLKRHSEYQKLRATTFIDQLKWDIPMDEEGRERDHYDQSKDPSISTHCVYGVQDGQEYLLGGVRIFELHSWQDSMTANEFRAVGMIPDDAIATLADHYDCQQVLELTRLCVQRRRWYAPTSISRRFNCTVARDLTYAAVYYMAEQTGRWKALALVDTGYLQVMQRSHFVFQCVYTQNLGNKSGYALTIIDLLATIQAICAAGETARAERMMWLCETPWQARDRIDTNLLLSDAGETETHGLIN